MNSLKSFVCTSCRRGLAAPNPHIQPATTPTLRTISSTANASRADYLDTQLRGLRNAHNNDLSSISDMLSPRGAAATGSAFGSSSSLSSPPPPSADMASLTNDAAYDPVHRIHVYATKHNTHMTLTQPPKKDPNDSSKTVDVLMSLSAGNLGFRKAGRGSYDAGYQLAAFMLKQIQERGLLRQLQRIEVVLRGFGPGREAVTKALLGQEGRLIRQKIKVVKDATRLKFGGPRSPKPRRLG